MSLGPENRQKTGRHKSANATSFKPGSTGNPGGRPKKTEEEFALERACEQKAPEALATIVDLMANAKQESVRLAAASYVIERRYGKAVERKEIRTGSLDDLPRDELKALRDALRLAQDSGGADAAAESRTTH